MARLFVAVWPPDDVALALTSLRHKDQKGIRFVCPENWHVTLRFLGDARPDDVIDALDSAKLAPARACLGPSVDVLAERALVIPVGGLDALAATVTRHTADLGDPPRRRFSGHLTIARVKRHAQMPRALGTLFKEEFDVEEIALVKSRLEPEGARYETIQTWPVG